MVISQAPEDGEAGLMEPRPFSTQGHREPTTLGQGQQEARATSSPAIGQVPFLLFRTEGNKWGGRSLPRYERLGVLSRGSEDMRGRRESRAVTMAT